MRILVSVLIFVLSINTHAQNFGGGVILGLSASQVGGDNLAGFNKAGLLVGAYANKKIAPLLILQMEITLIQKGSNNPKMNDPEHSNYNKEDITSTYIEVPLLLQFKQNELLKIEGGVEIAYLINAYYKDLNGEIPKYTVSPFTQYDFGLIFGIDYTFSDKFSLNTRLSNSILSIGSENYDGINSYDSSRKGKYNTVLSFAIHYNL